MRYLELFSKNPTGSKHVMLCLPNEFPLMIEYIMLSGNCMLRYYLAPKIEDEDVPDA